MTFADQYRRWFDYERDSHAKTLASLDGVPPAARAQEAFQKAVDLLAHIVAARNLWLVRFGVAPDPPPEMFPRHVALETLRDELGRMERAWAGHLALITDAALAREFDYQSLEGGRFRNSVADILTQLFGHSWYHRGQIAALVRSLGSEPAVTDFVFWARQPVT